VPDLYVLIHVGDCEKPLLKNKRISNAVKQDFIFIVLKKYNSFTALLVVQGSKFKVQCFSLPPATVFCLLF